jgi:putative ABC transport system permease protein
VNSLLHNIRYAARILRKQPSFAVVAVLTLALGIGANSAIFGIVNSVLLRPLPYRDADRVVMLWSHWTNWDKTWVSEPELADYRSLATNLEHVAGFSTTSFNLTSTSGEPARVRAAQVEASMFDALGVHPLTGRFFDAKDDRPGAAHVAVIGEGLWRSYFGSEPQILNRTILLDGTPHVVIGVMPAAVRLPNDFAIRSQTDLWVPLALGAPDPKDRGNHGLNALARLRPGATLQQAQSQIDAITAAFQKNYPGQYDPRFGVSLVAAPVEVFGNVRPALLVLLLAVGAVLLIACANVANLLLARSEGRYREIAIRAALGASRGEIVRHLLTESLLLAILGGTVGIVLAYVLMQALVALDPLKIPRVQDLTIDSRVLSFTAVVALGTGILFGIAPAFHAARIDLQPALKEGSVSIARSTGRLRQALVIAETACSVALAIAALLLTRSFIRVLTVDPGFRPSHLLTLTTSLPATKYRDGPSVARVYAELERRLRELPGVEAAGAVTGLPLKTTRGDWSIVIEGDPPNGRMDRAADWQVVTPGYFEAIGIRVRAGRTFTPADIATALPVIVINESMADKFWHGQNPIGRRLTMGRNDRWLTIIGVVADVRHRGLDQPARTEMFRPHAQFRFGDNPDAVGVPTMTWVLRTTADPVGGAGSARAAVRSVDPNLGISDVATMDQVLNDSTSDRQLDMLLFALLGGLAFSLAAVGIYGVVAYSVTQRTHEIGVRMALGAQRTDVVRMVIGQGLRLAVAGVVIGAAIAVIGSRLIQSMLFEVKPADPGIYVAVAGAVLAVAMLASYVPARRATRVDPIRALRSE